MTDIPVDSGSPLTYNPAKDDAKLREMLTVPAESYGVPSRWIRCMAAEILELRASATAAEKQRDHFRNVIERLASCEAFDVSRVIDATRDKELLARMNYAAFSLGVKP